MQQDAASFIRHLIVTVVVTCKTCPCSAYRKRITKRGTDISVLECRKKSPHGFGFPVVRDNDWCCEHPQYVK